MNLEKLNLRQVAYDPNSPHGSVRACLQKKRQVARSRDRGGIKGIGPLSCCSFIIYVKEKDGKVDNVFGNSRIRIPFQANGVEISTACAHGELTALWNAIADEDRVPPIIEIYIEMSPCDNCKLALRNLLKGNQEILYSFRHPDQRQDWEDAARRLCAG